MNALHAYLLRDCPLTQAELTEVSRHFHPRTVRRYGLLLQPGQICTTFTYVESGAFRMYRPTNGRPASAQDVTAWVFFEDAGFCELTSFLRQQPTQYYVRALEDSRVWSVSYADMQTLYGTVPAFQTFVRRHWEETILQFIDVAQSFQTDPAEARYARLTADRRLLHRLPLRHLASMLGITPFTLSRLRRKR